MTTWIRNYQLTKTGKQLLKMWKALVFVEHIEKHLKEMKITSHSGKVACKICEKSIDQIFNEETIPKNQGKKW